MLHDQSKLGELNRMEKSIFLASIKVYCILDFNQGCKNWYKSQKKIVTFGSSIPFHTQTVVSHFESLCVWICITSKQCFYPACTNVLFSSLSFFFFSSPSPAFIGFCCCISDLWNTTLSKFPTERMPDMMMTSCLVVLQSISFRWLEHTKLDFR